MTETPPTGRRQLDRAACGWSGQHFEVVAFSATTALARALVIAGCPDQPWVSYLANGGARSLSGRSLHQWARRVVRETDRGFRVEDYQEHQNAGAAPHAGRRLGVPDVVEGVMPIDRLENEEPDYEALAEQAEIRPGPSS